MRSLLAWLTLAGMPGAVVAQGGPGAAAMTREDWDANAVLYEYELCVAYHPALEERLGRAYQTWRSRHAESVGKIEAQPAHTPFPAAVADAFSSLPESVRAESYRKCLRELQDKLAG